MITCPVSRTTRVFFQRRVALFASVEDSPLLPGFEGHAEGMRARRAGRKRKGVGEGEQRRIIKEERKEEEGAVDVDVDVDERGCPEFKKPKCPRSPGHAPVPPRAPGTVRGTGQGTTPSHFRW